MQVVILIIKGWFDGDNNGKGTSTKIPFPQLLLRSVAMS